MDRPRPAPFAEPPTPPPPSPAPRSAGSAPWSCSALGAAHRLGLPPPLGARPAALRERSVLTGWLDRRRATPAPSASIACRPRDGPTHVAKPARRPRHYGAFRVERDLSEYRGTAASCTTLPATTPTTDLGPSPRRPDPPRPAASIFAALEKTGGDVTVVSHETATPAAFMLCTCKDPAPGHAGRLRYIRVRRCRRSPRSSTCGCWSPSSERGLPIRTLEDYITPCGSTTPPAPPGRAAVAAAIDPLAED